MLRGNERISQLATRIGKTESTNSVAFERVSALYQAASVQVDDVGKATKKQTASSTSLTGSGDVGAKVDSLRRRAATFKDTDERGKSAE